MAERRGSLGVQSKAAKPVDFDGLADALKPLAFGKRLELLHFLTRPHYLEEVASHLGIARQAAQKHVDQLLDLGVIRKQAGRRDSGPVQEYVVVPQRLFSLSEEFAKLGVLRPQVDEADLSRTVVSATSKGRRDGPAGPTLVAVHGMNAGASFALSLSDPCTIGRDGDRTVCLDYDPFASNRHAEVVAEDGHFLLVDAFSTNGTYLNWDRLGRGERRRLTPGDVIGIGKSLIVFRR